MEDLEKLLKGGLGGDMPDLAGLTAGLDGAQQLWTMLDDMAQSDPAAYAEFIGKQLGAAKAHEAAALPQPAFCAHVYVTEPARLLGPLFINACAHRSIKSSAAPDAPVNLAVGVLREATADAELVAATGLRALSAGCAIRCVDVITSEDHLARARSDATYRRDLFELFVGCVGETHAFRTQASSLKPLNPNGIKYAGGAVSRFRDARAPPEPAPKAGATQPAPALPGMSAALAEQLASLAGGGGRGGAKSGGGGAVAGVKGRGTAAGAGSAGQPLGGSADGSGSACEGERGTADRDGALGALRLPGAPTAAGTAAGVGADGAVVGPSRPLIQELPTSGPAPAPTVERSAARAPAAPAAALTAGACDGLTAAAAGPMPTPAVPGSPPATLSPIPSTAQPVTEPAYELQLDATVLALHVQLPQLASAKAVDLEVSDSAIALSVKSLSVGGQALAGLPASGASAPPIAQEDERRGELALRLQLPALIDSALATSKFDKKRRVLSVVAPLQRKSDERGGTALAEARREATPEELS